VRGDPVHMRIEVGSAFERLLASTKAVMFGRCERVHQVVARYESLLASVSLPDDLTDDMMGVIARACSSMMGARSWPPAESLARVMIAHVVGDSPQLAQMLRSLDLGPLRAMRLMEDVETLWAEGCVKLKAPLRGEGEER
jgi:hypothetical protein